MSFRLKTILGIALIEAALLLILITSALNFLQQSNEKQITEHVESTSRLFIHAIKDAVLSTDIATLESFVEEMMLTPDVVYIRIVSDGITFAERWRADIARHQREPDSVLSTINDGVFDTRNPVTEQDITYAEVEIGFSIEAIQRILDDASKWTYAIAAIEISLVAIFSFILGTYLTRQLQQLKLAAQTIAAYGPGHQISVTGNDELADVSKAFNSMSAKLEKGYKKYQEAINAQTLMTGIAEREEAKARAILAAALDGIITIDGEGQVIEYNSQAERIFGWKQEEILGQSMADHIIPPEYRQAHKAGMQHYLDSGEGPILRQLIELNAMHKDGHMFPVEITISPVETEDIVLFTAFIRDITQRKSNELELQLSAQAFETSEAMFITDANGRIIRANQAFVRISGYQPDEVLGKNPRLLSSGLHDRTFYHDMWEELLERREWHGEIYNKRKNGEIYPEYLNISAVSNAEGAITHFIAHFTDISEQKAHEREMDAARKKAEAASESKGRFLATMSHEIRTPMNGILGILELLKTSSLDEHQQELVKTGIESGELLLNIINNILDFSKMEAGKLEIEKKGFDLHKLFLHTVSLLKQQAINKGNTLELKLGEDVPQYVRSDSSCINQIVVNLLSNAIKFTDQGSIKIKVSADKIDNTHCILKCGVTDTGSGIPETYRHNLFDEFTMADQTHSRTHQGTGLGLAISKQLVELLDGHIDYNSKAGFGSCFFFDVPLEIVTAPSFNHQIPGSSSETIPFQELKVLLVEDNPANQMVISGTMKYAGIEVDIASNGKQAVDILSHKLYDIVFMDISMPEMDGMEATRQIRQLDTPACDIPIIALTAHALAGDRECFLKAGMDDYLTKPVTLDSIKHCLSRWTGGKAEHRVLSGAKPGHDNDLASNNLVDTAIIRQLINDTSPTFVSESIQFYINDTEQRLAHVQVAIVQQDIKTLTHEVHTLGSSAGAYGNLRMHQLAREIEKLSHEKAFDKAFALAEDFCDITPESLKLLNERFTEIIKQSAEQKGT